jgi:hypothetical protein
LTEIVWDPDDRKPPNHELLESEIEALASGARVKLTLRGEEWLVRALAPAAFCSRGADFSGRDLSARVAEFLNENGCPALVRSTLKR